MTSKKDVSNVFSVRLRSARNATGITQFDLGVLAGIDEYSASPRINQYERGVHFPDQGTVHRLAGVLGVPVSYLLEPNDQLAEFIRLAGKLSKEDLKRLIGYLRIAINDEKT